MNLVPTALRERLKRIRSVGAITGAGISAESGIPTYRGKGGIYDDPDEGDRTVDALSGPTLARDPDRTWRAVVDLARRSVRARPNAGHLALAEIERKVERFVLLTQNVDGLHQLGGSRNVIDIHGDIRRTRCGGCGRTERLQGEELLRIEKAPRCESCGGVVRPDVVLFGELLSPDQVGRMREEFYRNPPDLVLVAGTTALFPYIAEPALFARQLGKLTIEINPEPTDLSDLVDYSLRGAAGTLLPAIAGEL